VRRWIAAGICDKSGWNIGARQLNLDVNTNFVQKIFDVAQANRASVALKSSNHELTYERFRLLMLAYALRLRHHGVARSSVVAIDTRNPVANVALTLACAMVGSRWVHASKAAITELQLKITHVVHADRVVPPPNAVALQLEPQWAELPKDETQFRLTGFASPDDVWMIAQSSGTTGSSKFIPITFRDASQRLEYPFDVPPNERIVGGCLSMSLSVISLFATLRILVRGGTVLFGKEFDFLVAAGANYLTGSPAHFDGLCRRFAESKARIHSVAVAGGISSPRLYETLFKRFDVVRNVYSSSEAGVACSKVVTPETMTDGSAGPPEDSVSLEIVDDNDAQLPWGQVGIVRLRAPGQVMGYMADPETTKTTFREGWFYPGDLGFLSTDGDLHVTGRANDQLSLGGVKINANALDEVIQAAPGVVDGICFQQSGLRMVDELAAVLSHEPSLNARDVVEGVRKALLAKFGPSRIPKRIYVSDAIPRNENGKATRHLAPELVKNIEPTT
jgi:acyl-coenzyme A synthetase/AMP-(fatty) acid ligase